MATKQLYLLVNNGGDCSYSVQFVLDDQVIERLEEIYDEGSVRPTQIPGCDGDGFHYTTITVPADSTAESLGISLLTIDDVEELIG